MGRIISRYKNLSPTVKASLWFMVCSFIQKGIAFFTVPIYTRMLTTEEYGVYSVYLSWENIFLIFATLNLSAGVFNNGMVKYENNRNIFISSMQGLSTVCTVVVWGIYCVLMTPINGLTKLNTHIMLIMFCQIFFSPAYSYWMVRKRFEYKYRAIVLITLCIAIGTPIFSIFLLKKLEDPVNAVILGYAIPQIAIGAYFYIFNWAKGRIFFDKKLWRYGAGFNIPLIPHYLSYIILGQSDRVMINSLCGPSDAGIYTLAYQIAIVINLVTNAIDASFNPWTYKKLKEKEYIAIRRVTNCLIIVFSIGVLGLTLIAPELLLFCAPSEYQAAKWVMPPVIMGCFFMFIAGAFMRVEFFHEKKKFIMLASSLAAILNIVLNIVFIPLVGFIAAAYTTLVTYFIFSIFHYVAVCKTCKKNAYEDLPFNGKVIYGISTIVILVVAACLLLYNNIILRYGLVAILILGSVLFRKKLLRIYTELRKTDNS